MHCTSAPRTQEEATIIGDLVCFFQRQQAETLWSKWPTRPLLLLPADTVGRQRCLSSRAVVVVVNGTDIVRSAVAVGREF